MLCSGLLNACHRDAVIVTINPERRHQIYDMAWRLGQHDRLTPLPNHWQRYQQKLGPFADVPERETIFSTGYDDGFAQHPEEERDVAEMAYDMGYRSGQTDAWQHKTATPKANAFDHEAYVKGYGDGFNGRSHAFGRPY
ncbi:MAG: hypothetical protein JWO94_266 [Verrucomicrobiaceae bacterium]|nr:hypothetical protein [Verrucomicrobiaceae bacterium]